MKQTTTPQSGATPVPTIKTTFNRSRAVSRTAALWSALMSLCLLVELTASGQSAFRSQFTTIRATVPVNSTNTTILGTSYPTNITVVLVNGATNANFDVSGLPPGAGAVFTDTYGNPLPSTTLSTNMQIVLNTTNIPEGVYNFTLNLGGYDTNGLPVTNQFPFVLQAAHLWLGNGPAPLGFGFSNNWAVASNWLGGLPTATDDVVFVNNGAQTNSAVYGISTTPSVGVDTSVTVASLRFAQGTYTNLTTTTNITGSGPYTTNVYVPSTNALYHSIRIANGATLTITGTNSNGGLSLMRDTITAFGFAPNSSMGVYVYGASGTLAVNNTNANFSVLPNGGENPTLNFSNLAHFNCNVSRVSLADFRGYPNYVGLNTAYNAGRDTNTYSGQPSQMWATIYMAKTNVITATYVNPDNYNNEYTRIYAMTLQNNEQQGNGSSVNTYFYLGRTNLFNLDSINLIGSSSASGNGGGTRFNVYNDKSATNPTAYFRNVDGVSRMSIFSLSDDGGTNQGRSNVKSTTDFTYANFSAISGNGAGSGYLNLLVDRMYIARDRTMITSNQSPNVQGDLIVGSGVVDANSVWLGCQEHSNKVDWTTLYSTYSTSAYLNYCQGRLTLTNGYYAPSGGTPAPSLFRINKTLTLGYTADSNPSGSAQQYNTYGSLSLYGTNTTFMVSNIVCDGGLNYYDSNGRQNTISINGANLIVSNTIGYPDQGSAYFNDPNPQGIYLDTLTMTAGKLTLFVDQNRINVYTRSLNTPGIVPSIIRVASLANVTSFPATIPVISYLNGSSPFLNADVSALGTNYHGYVLNDIGNNSVDLYITTNTPNNLIWTGAAGNGTWDTTSLNWVTTSGAQTNFNLGDQVTFNDSSTVTNISISGDVVPSQTGVGMTISNSVNQYTFTGGTVAGTAQIVKYGTNLVEFDAVEQGPINITAGTFVGSGQIGTTIVYSNVVLNYTGNINGGLTSTGLVMFSGTEVGPVSIQGGYLDNSGHMSTTGGQVVSMAVGTAITNEANALIEVGALPVNSSLLFDVPNGSVLANFGTIKLWQPKMSVEGLLFGYGTISYPNGGGLDSELSTGSNDPRLVIGPLGVISPGTTPYGTISNMNLYCRFDYNNDPSAGQGVAGVGTVRIEVDFSNPNVNDFFNCDRWNNDTGYLLMTNINPSAGTFALGQTFQIFANSSGATSNYIDTLGFAPTILPYVPGPGMQWGTFNFNPYGSISVTNSPNVWDGKSSANWSTNLTDTSWKTGQTFANDAGAVFDDSASGSTTVNLTGNVAPDGYTSWGYTNTDNATYTNIFIFTNQPAITPGIVVSNALKDYVFTGNGHIRGITGLYKTGPGTLTLMTSNDFIGNLIVDNGTVVITNYGGMSSIVSLGTYLGGQMQNDIIMDGGTLNYVGLTNVSLSNGKGALPVFNSNGGTIGVASATNMLVMNKSCTGVGALTKTGPGTLQMQSTVDNYYGGTIVNGGILQLTAAAIGYGALTLNDGTALQLTNNFTLTNAVNVNGSASWQIMGSSTNIFSGLLGGNGTLAFSNAALFYFNGSLGGFGGTLSFGSSIGQFAFNLATNKNPCLGSAAATFNLGTGSATLENFNGSNLTYNLGALSGGPNTVLMGRATNSAAPPGTVYSIGANGVSTTFAGKIINGVAASAGLEPVSVVKVGAGTLWLNGASTYTGATTVSSGVLGGTGNIASPLSVAAGGTLAPGASATSIGTFTVSNNATLGGTVVMKLNTSGTPSNDMVVVTGTLTGGGALIVTNLGGIPASGSTFKLFNRAVTGFSSITLPTGNGTFVWATNLAVNGSITLTFNGLVSLAPTNLVSTVTNGTMTLTWPTDHLGWQLQVQTNPLSAGLSANPTNWYTVPDSTNVTTESFQMDPSQPSIFYRMFHP